MTVTLFLPCFVDALFPRAGISMVQILERLGHTVICPPEISCCGQPPFNSGYWDEARPVAAKVLEQLADAEAVVRKLFQNFGGDGAGFVPIAGVERRLAAAGNFRRADDRVAEAFEDLHHADARARKQRVHKTGNEKRDGHALRLKCERAYCSRGQGKLSLIHI